MSLINEALKKAQRARHQPAAAEPAAEAGAPAIAKRAAPMRAQTVLIGFAAAAALIVVSVVLTVYLVNRPPPSSPAPVSAPVSTPKVDLNAPSPVIVAPPIAAPIAAAQPDAAQNSEPVATTTPAPTAAAAATPPSSTHVAASTTPAHPAPAAPATPARVEPAPVTTESRITAPATAATFTPAPNATVTPATVAAVPPATVPGPAARSATPPAEPKPNPQISAYIDTLKVTGIRSSGTDSKVLMNDRVYRVNDIVERTLGIKLIKVAPDALTFSDANGFVYTKNF